MELPRRTLTDQNVYQVHNLKAKTAFLSTVYTVPTVRCPSPLLIDYGTRSDLVMQDPLCSEDLLMPVLYLWALADCRVASSERSIKSRSRPLPCKFSP